MVKRAEWLSITPEPERELPWAVAALAAGRCPAPDAVAGEHARIERLLLRGSHRRWLSYLHGVVELISERELDDDDDVGHARRLASAVISNHHYLLLGLPGRAAQRTAADRVLLASLSSNHDRSKGPG
jgi:hypothetical protein